MRPRRTSDIRTSGLGGHERPHTFHTLIQERLFERRVVLAQGVIDDELATRTAAQLLTLEALAPEPITLRLACPAGELGAVLSLADTIHMLGVELTAIAVGEVSGAAIGALAAAPSRLAYPHARFALIEPKAEPTSGRASDIDTYAKEYLTRWHQLVELVADATGRQAEAVASDFREGRFLTAAEAKGYGLVSGVVSAGSETES